MAWSTPITWSTAQVVTAANLNAQIRDNLRETSPFTVTTAGDLSYADAANSMNSRLGIGADGSLLASSGTAPVWRTPATAVNTGSASNTSTSYISWGLWAIAAEVEVTCTTGTTALVLWKSSLANNTAGAIVYTSYAVSGATTVVAAHGHSVWFESSAANDQAVISGFDFRTGLTAGSNTFTFAASVSAGTGTITRPEICVIPY